MNDSSINSNRALPKEIKVTILKALKDGYFDDAGIEIMKRFLFPDGEPLIIEIIDNRDKVIRDEEQQNC